MLPLFLIVFVDLVGFGTMMPLLPYYAKIYGASPAGVSLLFALYSVGQFLFSPVWGRLSDRYGRKPVLLITLAGAVAGYVTLGFAQSLPVLFAARLFSGIMAGNISTAMAYVADVTKPENRARGMGLIGAAFGLGFIFGPVIGGAFAGNHPSPRDFAVPSFVSAGLSGLAFLGVAVFLDESLPRQARGELKNNPRRGRIAVLGTALANPELRRLVLALFLTTTAMAVMETSFTVWINATFGWGPRQVAFAFTFIGLIMAGIQGGGIGRLVRRFGEKRLLVAGALLLTAGLAAIPFSPEIAFLLAATTLVAIGYGLSQPVLNSLVSKQATDTGNGLVMGVSQSAGSLARIAGPVLSSAGFALAGVKAPFLIGAAAMLPVLFLLQRIAQATPLGGSRSGTTAASPEP